MHELTREIHRRRGRPAKPRTHVPGPAGVWRPLTRKARQLIHQVRRAKLWRLQKQLIAELADELANGRRVIDRARERAAQFGQGAGGAALVIKRGVQFAGRRARAFGRSAAKGWCIARPHAARAARAAGMAAAGTGGRLTRRVQQWRQQRRNRAAAPQPAVRARPAATAAIPRYPATTRVRARQPRPARPTARTR
jgi:hypothetical protein